MNEHMAHPRTRLGALNALPTRHATAALPTVEAPFAEPIRIIFRLLFKRRITISDHYKSGKLHETTNKWQCLVMKWLCLAKGARGGSVCLWVK